MLRGMDAAASTFHPTYQAAMQRVRSLGGLFAVVAVWQWYQFFPLLIRTDWLDETVRAYMEGRLLQMTPVLLFDSTIMGPGLLLAWWLMRRASTKGIVMAIVLLVIQTATVLTVLVMLWRDLSILTMIAGPILLIILVAAVSALVLTVQSLLIVRNGRGFPVMVRGTEDAQPCERGKMVP